MSAEITVSQQGGVPEAKKPVVVLLHGYGSNEQDLPSLMNFLPGNLPWISLRAPLALGGSSFAWFPLAAPGHPDPNNVAIATDIIWKWIDENLPPDCPIVLIGFSQGGLMATQLLRTRPDRILGTVILAGFVVDAVQPGDEVLKHQLPAVIYCRGLDDQVIHPDAVTRTEKWLATHTTETYKTYYRLGHSIDARVMDDVAEYFVKTLGIR